MKKLYRVTGYVSFSGSAKLKYTVKANNQEEAIDCAFDKAIDFIDIDTSGLSATELPMDQRMRAIGQPELGV